MYRDILDLDEGFYLCRFSLGGDTAKEYEEHLDGMRNAMIESVGLKQRPAVVIVQDSGYPAPDPTVRKRVAEMTDDERFRAVTAIVTQNRMIRGVVTALNWLRRRSQEETIHESAEAAFIWLEEQRRQTMPRMRAAAKKLEIE